MLTRIEACALLHLISGSRRFGDDAYVCCSVVLARRRRRLRRFSEFLCTWPTHVSINSWKSLHIAVHSNRTSCANALENTPVCLNFVFFLLCRQTNVHAVHGGCVRIITHQSKCYVASLSLLPIYLSTYFRHTQNQIHFYRYRHRLVDGRTS